MDVAYPGDAVLLRVRGSDPTHVGVYLGESKMLHVQSGTDSCVAHLDSAFWRNRVIGYFRWQPST